MSNAISHKNKSQAERQEILKRILGGEAWPPVKEGNDEQS